MNLTLDTTYLLPFTGIGVSRFTEDEIEELVTKNKIWVNEISLFELSAKGAKYVSQGKLDQRRVTRGLKALLIDNRITRVVLHDTHVNETAIRLRGLHEDYIDCLVVATGLHYSEAVVTEDSRIHGLVENESFRAIVDSVEPGFRILSIKEALK